MNWMGVRRNIDYVEIIYSRKFEMITLGWHTKSIDIHPDRLLFAIKNLN